MWEVTFRALYVFNTVPYLFFYTCPFLGILSIDNSLESGTMPLSDAKMQLQTHASLCKANEKADDAVWKAAPEALEAKTAKKLSKDTSLKLMLDMVNAVKNSIERLNVVGRA